MKKAGMLIGTLSCSLLILSACSNADSMRVKSPTVKPTASASSRISQSKPVLSEKAVINQDGKQMAINDSEAAQTMTPDSFILMNNIAVSSSGVKSGSEEQESSQKAASNPAAKKPSVTASKPAAKKPSVEKSKSATKSPSVITNKAPSKPLGPVMAIAAKPKSTIVLETKKVGPVFVKIPKGWIRSSYDGGDFDGYNYVNPNDPNETMQLVFSTCAGCGYPDGDPDNVPLPRNLIPVQNVFNSYVFNKGLSAGYSYSLKGTANKGNGVVTMVQYEGYAYAEIVLPVSKKSIATEVLNSFVYHSVYNSGE